MRWTGGHAGDNGQTDEPTDQATGFVWRVCVARAKPNAAAAKGMAGGARARGGLGAGGMGGRGRRRAD
eukprot:3930239-Prymnesium_polylepis.1